MSISLIVAMAENQVIGRQNQLPWHLPADLQHFKRITQGKSVLMGRKTYVSIGKPLPNRHNIIVSHDSHYQAPGCTVFTSLASAVTSVTPSEELMVIGGAQIFAALLPQAQRFYLTLIHAHVEGDVFFPAWSSSAWQEITRQYHAQDDRHAYAFSFITLGRI